MAAVLAAMQAMQAELNALRQAAPAAVPAGDAMENNVAPEMAIPVSAISLMKWVGMKLDTFDGTGTPVQAADWLTYVGDKMDVFEVVDQDHVRYSSQLLKGEAQIWWKGVQAAHPAAYGLGMSLLDSLREGSTPPLFLIR
jgi:hypothetical protein